MTTLNDVYLRAATDSGFREALKSDPKAALNELGLQVPESVAVRVVESTADELVIALPPLLPEDVELDEDALAGAAGGATPAAILIWLAAGAAGAGGAYGGYKGVNAIIEATK